MLSSLDLEDLLTMEGEVSTKRQIINLLRDFIVFQRILIDKMPPECKEAFEQKITAITAAFAEIGIDITK